MSDNATTPIRAVSLLNEDAIPGALVWSLLRLMLWLVAASYIQETQYLLQIALFLVWFGLFFWRYVFRAPSDADDALRFCSRREAMGLALPAKRIPAIISLWLVIGISVPWWVAAFTRGCSDPSSLHLIWRNHIPSGKLGPLGAAVLLVVMRAATYPLVEEFAFRGWILAPLRRKLGDHGAVITAAILFALAHISPSFMIRNFLLGVLFGYAVILTGSIWAAFAMHFAFDLVSDALPATVLYRLLQSEFQTTLFRCPASWLAVMLTCAVTGAILLAERQHDVGKPITPSPAA